MRNWTSLLCVCLLLVSCTPEPEKKPNIIYILADDLGYGDVSVYNPDGKIKTPNIDQLASEGMQFTDAHSSSSVCTPTRYGILTGRYSWRTRLKNGVLTGKSPALISMDQTTVASLLKRSGYYTGFIGKWHLGWNWHYLAKDTTGPGWNPGDFNLIDFSKPIGHSPNDLGFDYAYGHAASLDMAPYVYVENGKATATPTANTVNTGKYSWWREGPTAEDFVHEEVTPHVFEKAIEFVRQAGKSETPFFLYLALPSPHTPILPTKAWKGKSNLNDYGDFVLMIDDYIGKLVNTLSSIDLNDNTIVIFTSDNGCSPAAGIEEMLSMGHFPSKQFRGHKADIYEGGHRVPFIVKWPATIQRNSQSNALVSTTDLFATIADITNQQLDANEGVDSFSMLPLLTGNESGYEREAMVQHSIDGEFAIRRGPWKLILTGGSGGWSYPNAKKHQAALDSMPFRQLYNLTLDPAESNNVLAPNWNVVSQLQSLLKSYIESGRSTPGIPQRNDSIDFEWKQIDFMKN